MKEIELKVILSESEYSRLKSATEAIQGKILDEQEVKDRAIEVCHHALMMHTMQLLSDAINTDEYIKRNRCSYK